MALRAVLREARRAALRLDGHAGAVLARDQATGSVNGERLRRTLNLQAWLLPEPFSPEAVIYAATTPPGAQWSRLLHFGVRRALRAQLGKDELLNDGAAAGRTPAALIGTFSRLSPRIERPRFSLAGLTLLKELNSLEHDIECEIHRHRAPSTVKPGTCVLDASRHAALAAALDGTTPERAERQIEERLERLSARALARAAESTPPGHGAPGTAEIVSHVSHVLFSEAGLKALPPRATPGGSGEEVLSYARSALVHRALEAGRGTPLSLGLVMAEVVARAAPELPAPRLLALPRSAALLATFSGGALHPAQPEPTAAAHGDASCWDRRILVCVADAAGGAPRLFDPSAGGARTQLAPSAALLAALRRSDASWEAWAHRREAEARAAAADYATPWEVPASALLDRRGALRLLLQQLVELYHTAGTPHAIRLHHRCAALLAELEPAGVD